MNNLYEENNLSGKWHMCIFRADYIILGDNLKYENKIISAKKL